MVSHFLPVLNYDSFPYNNNKNIIKVLFVLSLQNIKQTNFSKLAYWAFLKPPQPTVHCTQSLREGIISAIYPP